jgi:MerR family transcriptional regulator, thiopeptide resistance regulator
MLTITKLAKQFGLSRSTLLYYDKIALLSPSKKTNNGYRLYSDNDLQTLKKIRQFADAGLSLKQIKQLLASDQQSSTRILNNRLTTINTEIQALRAQQQTIVQLLENKALLKKTRIMDKKTWVSLLRSAGLDDSGMLKWHQAFEASSPEMHQDFLESLGLSATEIKKIRAA